MLKVSAIVPVYNPGSDIDDCVRSLVGQSLPHDEYEVIFVDDGSTDGTGERLDRLAAEHPHVRVEHIPNSGWPGRPRNVGLDMARGEYVYFVDNDDWIADEALERLHARAVADDADVVVGKIVGHGKRVPRGQFGQNRSGMTIEWAPLLGMLTPHKLFRRSLLEEHAIRFPEGRRRLEDHVFVVHAYLHARAVSVLADYACYHWVRRPEAGANASTQTFDPKGYYENVREVLDLVVDHLPPGPARDRLLSHWHRGKALGWVGGKPFARKSPEYRRALYEEVRALVLERFGPESDAWLAQNMRVRSHLVREGSYESLERLAEAESELRAVTTVDGAHWEEDGTFVMPFEARLVLKGDRPLLFERRESRIFWVPPELPVALPERTLEVTDDIFNSGCLVVIRSREDKSEYVLPATELDVLLEDADGAMTPVISGEARIEPGRAAAGAAPAPGKWDVVAQVTVVGFQATGKVRARRTDALYTVRIDEAGGVPRRKRRGPSRPPSLKGRLARKLPRVARVVRRAREERAATRAR